MLPVPDLSTLMLYGFPVMGLIALVLALVEYFAGAIETKAKSAITGVLVALAYLFIANQGPIENLAPWVATWLPQVLTLLTLIGSVFGLVPLGRYFVVKAAAYTVKAKTFLLGE